MRRDEPKRDSPVSDEANALDKPIELRKVTLQMAPTCEMLEIYLIWRGKGLGSMWPWSKKKSISLDGDMKQRTAEPNIATNGPPVLPKGISPERVGEAIIALRGTGAHFQISYAQMNGYNEKLTNPSRLSEISALSCNGPSFSEAGKNFAAICQIEELTHLAQHPEGNRYASIQSEYVRLLQQREDSLRWARQLLADVLVVGNGDLDFGFRKIGFNFSEFLAYTITERREIDVARIFAELAKREDSLRPLFLRAYQRGRNKYGEIEMTALSEEMSDFFTNFFPNGALDFFTLSQPTQLIIPIVIGWVEVAQNDKDIPSDGIDFEHWCARELEEQGWSVTVSKASGDQGIDVVASKQSMCVAVQCKRYSTPIGNKAVQEAFSGAKHYGADIAVVMGTGGFTKSAQDLAISTNVILLDAEMIDDFTRQVMSKI
jgi:hypothetical protein